MITVSTISEREATVASGALETRVPADMGWEVYLRGTLYRSRDAQPALSALLEDPGGVPEPPVETRLCTRPISSRSNSPTATGAMAGPAAR